MLRICAYFTGLGLKDGKRARTQLAVVVLILAGICLSLLLVRGVRQGMMQQVRHDIESSPCATLVEVSRTPKCDRSAFTVENSQYFTRWLPALSVVIPEAQMAIRLATDSGVSEVATLLSTVPREPVLSFHGASVSADPRSVVLTAALARKLGLADSAIEPVATTRHRFEESRLTMLVTRQGDHVSCSVPVTLSGVIPGEAMTVYGHVRLLDRLEDFKQGRPVPELGVAARPQKVASAYDGYLSFCLPNTGYGALDRQRLHMRGLEVRSAEELEPAGTWRQYGLLGPAAVDLPVNALQPESAGRHGTPRVDLPPLEVERITDADDVIVPWVTPQQFQLNGRPHLFVGLTLRSRWLRPYFRSASICQPSGATELLVDVFAGDASAEAKSPVTVRNHRGEDVQLPARSLSPDERLAHSFLRPWFDEVVTRADAWVVRLAPRLGLTVEPGQMRALVVTSTLYRQAVAIDQAICAPPPLPLAITSAEHLSLLAGWSRDVYREDVTTAKSRETDCYS